MRWLSSRIHCEVFIPSIILLASVSPAYASCVTCVSGERSTYEHLTQCRSETDDRATCSPKLTQDDLPASSNIFLPQSASIPEFSPPPTTSFVLTPSDFGVVVLTPPQTKSAPDASALNVKPKSFPAQLLKIEKEPAPTTLNTQNSTQIDVAQNQIAQSSAILVRQINVTGNTAISTEAITSKTSPLIGKQVTFEELQGVADSITQLYLDQGYITSRAILPEQTPQDGILQIQVIEGGLESIEVEGTQQVNQDYVRSRVALGGVTPLKQDRLEDQLRLLRADPLFENVEASLKAGTKFGQSILIVRVVEASPFSFNLSADNFSPPDVGSERLGIGVAYRNLTGDGDQLAAAYSFSTNGGTSLLDFSYRRPLNPMNGTILLRAAPSSYRITRAEFAAFGIRGDTDLYEIIYRQPLVRTPRQEFALSLGLTRQSGQTFLFNNQPQPFGIGPDANGISTTSVLKFGQDYVSRDVQGAWALRSQLNFGLGILGATSNPDPVPDGNFFSWLFQAQRVQLLSPDQILIIQGDLQLSANTLLPSQQFVIGGGQSVRGFRQNARSGDNGFRFSVEDRITVHRDESGNTILQVAPFVDIGSVWNVGGNPNLLPSQTFLAGGGLGLLWEPIPRLNIRLDYAIPFVNLSDRGGNAQESAFYFSVNYGL